LSSVALSSVALSSVALPPVALPPNSPYNLLLFGATAVATLVGAAYAGHLLVQSETNTTTTKVPRRLTHIQKKTAMIANKTRDRKQRTNGK
jgi:hypothetical protein